MPLLLAGITAALFYPIYTAIRPRLKFSWAASLAVILLVCIAIGIPIATAIGLLISEVTKIVQQPDLINNFQQSIHDFLVAVQKLIPQRWQHFIDTQNIPWAEWLKKSADLLRSLAYSIFMSGTELSKNVMGILISLGVYLFALFYLFMDGPTLVKKTLYWFPMENKQAEELLKNFMQVTYATLLGTLLIGIIQGTLGGILLAATGFPAPVLWAFVMSLLSLIPGIGVSLVLVPAIIWAFFHGQFMEGTFLIIGTAVIGLIDNFLRPLLVGKRAHMHDLLVFLLTLGGLSSFGLPGFILGPAFGSLALTLLNHYEHTFAKHLEETDGAKPIHEEKT